MYFVNYQKVYITLSLIFLCSYTCGTRRSIKCVAYPSEADEMRDSNVNILHVIASGAHDSVHYMWSSYKLPSVVIARTTLDTKVNIDLQKIQTFTDGAINFTKEPLEAVGITISELWEKTYKTDDAEVKDVILETPLNLESFIWKNLTKESYSCSDFSAAFNMVATDDDVYFSKNGTFEVQFSVAGDETLSSDFPRLIFTGNSTQIKLLLNRLFSNSSRTRYGLEIIVSSHLSNECSDRIWKESTTKSISDEFSPGSFTDIDLSPPCSGKDWEDNSFLTWRPLAYIGSIPTVANSSDAKITSNCVPVPDIVARSIAELFFKDQSNVSSNAFNITFGTAGDGFYPKTEYTSWIFMAGIGLPVKAKLSMTAIIYLSTGLGALVLFLLSGVVFLGIRRCREKDDDLLLSDGSMN